MIAEVEYAIGRFMKVRKLSGTFQITDSWMVGGTHHKRRRYRLYAVKGTGAILEMTESFVDDMIPLPLAATAEELTLVPDPDSAPSTDALPASQEPAAPAEHTEPAPDAEQPAADAICSSRPAPDGPGSDGPGEEDGPWAEGWAERSGELQNPFKPVRKFPRRPTYKELRGIVYNARFKGLEEKSEIDLSRLPDETPIAVAVTHETNGHAIWIITIESGQAHLANLEIFYPNARGSAADALEYAVLLALRQVPIRSEDLEILLLELF